MKLTLERFSNPQFIDLAPIMLKKGNRSNSERAITMYLGQEVGGLSLKGLARRYGLDESMVSQTAG